METRTPEALIGAAFARLQKMSGFVLRSDQQQLAYFLGDLIEGQKSGIIEAPTGLGKSLASLIPAIAHGLASGKKTVIATYTNVLAEQYWRKDLPLALSLFGFTMNDDGDVIDPETGEMIPLKVRFLIGRQRYACLIAMDDVIPRDMDRFRAEAKLGIESEFRAIIRKAPRELNQLWSASAVPSVCPGRGCPMYDECFYYSARRKAESANLIITNHSVVIQDALMSNVNEESKGLLGSYDFLILDEAHDFQSAAASGLEFEINVNKISAMIGVSTRLEKEIMPIATKHSDEFRWKQIVEDFREQLEAAQGKLVDYGNEVSQKGILACAPTDIQGHPGIKQLSTPPEKSDVIATMVGTACEKLATITPMLLAEWETPRIVGEIARNYLTYIREYGLGSQHLMSPPGVSVSHVSKGYQDLNLRLDTVGIDEPLRELIWDKRAYACISATVAIDGSFDFFKRTLGCKPDFEEILPSPFDYSSQAALYIPAKGRIPDPTLARREGREEEYFSALARELMEIINTCDGRTLALFHSRKEMEAVYERMHLPEELPLYIQPKSGTSTVGELFKKNISASLFALRSFWTGFDAPGETLSCVALVRVPFEVPFDPPAIVRMAHMQSQGLDPFREHTLPNAKMMVRQGAGRLIRKAEDLGIIALLDARLVTKPYGEEIIDNLPSDLRRFSSISDAAGWIGFPPLRFDP